MTQLLCAICGRSTADGYGCVPCSVTEPQRLLAEIGDMAGPALDIAQRQTSGGSGGGGGKPGSTVPIDLGAMARYDAVRRELSTWVRVITEERGAPAVRAVGGSWGPSEGVREGQTGRDDLRAIAAWLAEHCEWMRHRAQVDKFVADVRRCHRVLAGLARRGGKTALVGMCDCERVLYARIGRQTITCPGCELEWDVDESRDTLRRHLDERHVTAAEAAHLAAYLDTDRTSVQIRKLVNKWAERQQIEAHPVLVKHQHRDTCEPGCTTASDTIATYRFGDIADRIAHTPRRAAVAAEMGA